MQQICFTIPVTPRTKKNSSIIAGYGRKCPRCNRPQFSKIVPSDAYEDFLRSALFYAAAIRESIEHDGYIRLPLQCPISIRALIYREAETGDWNGYTDAIADVLQQSLYYVRCANTECRTEKGAPSRVRVSFNDIERRRIVQCSRCRAKFVSDGADAEQYRAGLGIIADDALIRDWDGTRLLKDAENPRIEITVTTIDGSLFAEQGEE